MQVRASWISRNRLWRLYDVKGRTVIGYATRVLLRDATFLAPNISGQLEAADWSDDHDPTFGTQAAWLAWDATKRANNAYSAAAGRLGAFVHAASGEFNATAAPMVLLTHTPGGKTKRKAAILAFDPCQMTAEESERATQ